MIFFGEKSLRRAVSGYLDHYHRERNHQSLGNRLIEPDNNVGRMDGEVQCRERLVACCDTITAPLLESVQPASRNTSPA